MAIQSSIHRLFRSEEIGQSVDRLDNLLRDQSGNYPLSAGNDSVGSCSLENRELRISFRGSIGRPMEILQIGLSALAPF